MKFKFFGKNIDPACEYCALGKLTSDGKNVLCKKKGVTALYYHCRRFKYDPIKRVPKKPTLKLANLSQQDFEL